MHKVIISVVILVFSCLSPISASGKNQVDISNIVYQAGIPKLIISEINNARESIDIMIFKFDYKPIADAMILAHDRGVKVRALIDFRSTTFNMHNHNMNVLDYLSAHGVDVWMYNDAPNILHYKVVQIDGKITLTGSLNFFTHDINYDYEMFIKMQEPSVYQAFDNQLNNILADTRTTKHENKFIGELPDVESNIYSTKDLVKPIETNLEWIKFSPETIATNEVISVIKSAKKRIILMESMFNDKSIADELIKAQGRGVAVKVITNKGFEDFYKYLSSNGIFLKVYDSVATQALMHHKTILIDYDKVFTGTLNLFDRSLLSDREIMMLFNSSELNIELSKQFTEIWNDDISIKHMVSA